ncbi:RICIN domain-containing protein [Mangrovibacterium diazotrophicum]|uniref:Putative secreted protein (Por secretion system target) n=1 Tax=Mangrovibacterium diazotrophicum TaxID=1261403 RepID=A0A419W612_9BACT|nr:RICIN domain-containing protein [Mangrovibacterium diazotrophicum]RKD90903.1 putative secreted protein (Por secretion system target) [Mangrovibacterium diazotrophicum]
MKYIFTLGITLLIIGFSQFLANAQTASTADNLVTQPIPDRTVTYSLSAPGVEKPIIWGLDLAWLDQNNIIRGSRFMGKDIVDVVRSSFMPTDPVVDGALTGTALTNTNLRINIINTWLNPSTQVVLNSDHPSIDPTLAPSNPDQAKNWAELLDVTRVMHVAAGRTVVTVSPFNEPDYSATGQGTIDDFYDIILELKKNSNFNNIRISGGNTLNDDVALEWYNYLDPAGLDEGNTHQLAGDFDHYAAFFQAVRANGDHATADELHNVMEAMVGVEYGMQTGIWWGWAEYARGEFCKASRSGGARLGYAEHRPNWTAASVYRAPDGKVQAFVGSSERQAVTTTYRFVSEDEKVYYDGNGPQRQFTVVMPGGTGYQNGQTNAERVVNITRGEDVQPAINGKYILVNKASGKVAEVADGSTTAGANLQQGTYANATYQQWNVAPVDSRIGGDFSYYTMTAVHSGKSPDVYNWSLNDGDNIATWDYTKGANQQWYLEYAGDGWFYIRSRHSALCLEGSSDNNIVQREKNINDNILWRFLPVDATVEFAAPAVPTNLTATGNASSVKLEWTASTDTDVAGYDILRASSSGGDYKTIARNVDATSCVDNTTLAGVSYFYKIRAVDKALNRSGYSDEASAASTGENDLVEYLKFEGDTKDNSLNLNHAVAKGGTFITGRQGTGALSLNGSSDFVQLPEDVANHPQISVVAWVKRNGYTVDRHIFEFSSVNDEYMYLSEATGGQMQLGIKYNGTEQTLTAPTLPVAEWAHLVVTLGDNGASMYVNGALVAESATMTIRPSDFNPFMNYIGVNSSTKKLFGGAIDDFRIYNYQLSGTQVTELYNDLTTDVYDMVMEESDLSVWPNPANDILHINYMEFSKRDFSTLQLLSMSGAVVMNIDIQSSGNTDLNVSNIATGVYLLRLTTSEGTITKKIVIKH